MPHIDHELQRCFPAGGCGLDAIRLTAADAVGAALRVRLERDGGPPVVLDLLRPHSSQGCFARLDGFDVIIPGALAPGRASEQLLEDAVARLAAAAIETTPLDWVETLGEQGDQRFLGGEVAEIKLTAACDQRCVFCKSPRNLANHATPEEVEVVLPRLARKAKFLTLSGGETTLAPDLERTIRLARAAGFAEVEVQTNGMSLDEPGRARRLADAGATNVLISLHAHRADLSDRLTGTPGGFQRTLRGIDHAIDAGLQLALCHVICDGNHEFLVPYASFVSRRWRGHELDLVFTLAIPTYRVREDPGLMPPLSEIGPELRAALRRFLPARTDLDPPRGIWALLGPVRRHRARVIAHCGLPMCVLGERAAYHDEWHTTMAAPAQAEMVHPTACAGCVLRPRCSGLWRIYVERLGNDGIAPVGAGDPVGDARDPCYRAQPRPAGSDRTAKCTSR